jgi:thermitase
VPLKFLGSGGGYTSGAVEALNYAVNKGVKISNNSWGGGGYSQALADAINRTDAGGRLFVAAAGNGGPDGVGDNNDGLPLPI